MGISEWRFKENYKIVENIEEEAMGEIIDNIYKLERYTCWYLAIHYNQLGITDVYN